MSHSPTSQTAQILAHLKAGNTLTPLEALQRFSCFRLSGRALELRREGYPIKTEMIEIGNKRVARYSMGEV